MNLPADFIQFTRKVLGEQQYDELVQALEQESPVSIRLNPYKSEVIELKTPDAKHHSVKWSRNGVYLDQRLTFTFDPLFHAGCYYVQEASSMFLEQAITQYVNTSARVLDLCAAPGGKSTHIRSLLPEGSLLVSNEVIRSRSQVLAENMTKWGHPDVVVTNNDPADFSRLNGFFDVIVADVPCSGEGMFRKDRDSISEWSLDNVEICRQRQRRIIADVWESLKPGGILIYSTCTYNTGENEENVEWIAKALGAEFLSIAVPGEWNVTGNLAGKEFPVYRFLPHKTRGEGFFLAALRKEREQTPEDNNTRRKKNKKNSALPVPNEYFTRTAKTCLKNPDDFVISLKGNMMRAVTKSFADEISVLEQTLRVIQSGIHLGEIKGKDLVPSHNLSVSHSLNADVFEKVDIAYEQAISYLRKEAIVLNGEIARGYVLLTYKHVPLGWVKNIGNRANNLYPQEWRIRSGYLPEEIRVLE